MTAKKQQVLVVEDEPKIAQLLKDYLTHREQRVIGNACSSEYRPVTSGVPKALSSDLFSSLFSWMT